MRGGSGGRPLSVFLSHTSELREFPKERSFLAAAEAAVARAYFAVADMAYFTARHRHPVDYCQQRIEQADVYVGIVGFRYGSPVPDRPERSYVELELETARHLGLPCLIFLLDARREVPLPVEWIVDHEHGRRQATFRRWLETDAGLTVAFVATPPELETDLYQALIEIQLSRSTTHGMSAADWPALRRGRKRRCSW